MSARRSSQNGSKQPIHQQQQQILQPEFERENSFPAVSFLLSSEAPANNLYERERYHSNVQEQQNTNSQIQMGFHKQGGSSDLHSKCKRTISLLKMHQREPSYESLTRCLQQNGEYNVPLEHKENYIEEAIGYQQGMPPPQGSKEVINGNVRGIDVLRLEYKVKELEGIISELSSINSSLQKSIQSSNQRIVVLTKQLEGTEINLLEQNNKSSLLLTQLQRVSDDHLIREQQILSNTQAAAAENFERVKKTYEQQLETRRIQAIQSTKLFKTTVADLQKELEKVTKKLEIAERSNRQLEGVVQQKNKIITSMGVRKSGEYETILEEKNAQIAQLQNALKEFKKTFKQEDRLVKDLSSRESNLQDKVQCLQEENQKLHFEIKKAMRIASTEVKSMMEQKRQKEATAKEKEEQYERFLQVQQRQVERFQRELKLALKSKKIEVPNRDSILKKGDLKHNNYMSGSNSTRQNQGSTNRTKRSQSSSSVPAKKVVYSLPNEFGEHAEKQQQQYATLNGNGYGVSLPEQVKIKKNQMSSQNYIDQISLNSNTHKRADNVTYPIMNGEISYMMQDTQAEGDEQEEMDQIQETDGDQEEVDRERGNHRYNSEVDNQAYHNFEEREGESVELYHGDDQEIHDRIEFLQKQLILKQNENFTLQAQLFQESQNGLLDDQSESLD